MYSLEPEHFAPEFQQLATRIEALAAQSAAEPAEQVAALLGDESLVSEVARGIFAFPVLSQDFCGRLAREVDHFNAALPSELKGRPNSMNNHGVLLDEAGFTGSLTDALLAQVVSPLARLLFPEQGGDSLDNHRCFTVQYQLGRDVRLQTHYDNAEVTLNVSLTQTGAGGDLVFEGEKWGGAARRPPCRYRHRPGWGVLHLGSELHCAEPVVAGKRTNLIMWCRSTAYRRQCGCAMCGETTSLRLLPADD